jgi:hypothetical protein
MYTGLHVKYLLFLSHFNNTWIFSTDSRKNAQLSNFKKTHSVGVEPHADRQTDRRTDKTMLLVAFRNFANAPKN